MAKTNERKLKGTLVAKRLKRLYSEGYFILKFTCYNQAFSDSRIVAQTARDHWTRHFNATVYTSSRAKHSGSGGLCLKRRSLVLHSGNFMQIRKPLKNYIN